MIAAGKLDRRVTLQAKSTTRDAVGGEVITWVDQATVWAEVRDLSGRYLVAAQQAQSEVTGTITIRTRSDIQPDWRATEIGDVYTIHAITLDQSRQFQTLHVSRGLKNG